MTREFCRWLLTDRVAQRCLFYIRFVYIPDEMWMQLLSPCVEIKFDIKNLISRRSFIFARAGFGKSNLNKLLFSHLYREQPYAEKRGGRGSPGAACVWYE